MKNLLKGLTRILPAYGVFPVIFSFVFNCLVYSGSRMIAGGWYHHNIETGVDRSIPFVPEFPGDLFWMLCILGRQLHSYCKAGSAQRLSVFYRRFYIKMCLPCVFSCISNDKYKTVDHRERFVESGSSVAVFD